MSYPTAYRSNTARDRAGTGFQRPPTQDNVPPSPREAGPWDRPARGPQDRSPRRDTTRGPYHPNVPANDNGTNPKVPNRVGELARRGVTLMRRVHPLLKWLDLLEWLLDMLNARLDARAPTGWTYVSFGCTYPGGRTSAAFANFCLDQQPLHPSDHIQPGATISTNKIGDSSRYSRGQFLDGLAVDGWWRFAGRWDGPLPNGTPQRAPDVFVPHFEHLPEYNPPDPWQNNGPPKPLPWEVLPYMRPNQDAPEPIRRQNGPNKNDPEYNPQTSPAPGRDPFVYPPLPGPDIWIDPLPRRQPGWWKPPLVNPRPIPRPDPVTPRPVDPVTPVTPPREAPIIRTAPGHRFRKPGAREKENKRQVQGPLAQAWNKFKKGVNVVTESLDAMDCVYGALPEKIRKREQAKRHGKDPNTKGKLKLIYQHAQQVDMLSMIDCLAKEHLQDAAIGKAAKKHADLRKKYGLRGGYLSRANKLPDINIKL